MKQSVAALSAAVVIASAQSPTFLNSAYNVVAGEPFTLTFDGCDAGCTITLENGPEDNMQAVQELDTNATGGEATVVVDEVPTDTYAFRITDNETGEYNFGDSFDFEGTGEPETPTTVTTTEEVTSTVAETTSEEPTSTEESTTEVTETEETTVTTVVSTTAESTTTEEATTTETEEETTTEESDPPETTVPEDGAAGALARPMALVFGAVAAMLLFN